MQVHRLIEILHILLNEEKVTSEELAEKLEVSKRTIYRDIECLAQAKIPVMMTKGFNGGISLMEGYTLNKTFLSEDEKQEVLSALSAVGAVESKSKNAISKLSSIFGIDNYDWIEVDFSNWYNVGAIEEKFDKIKQFMQKKVIVEIEYMSSNGKKDLRKVAPLKLCFKSQAWYVYAFCYMRNDYRFFKLSRIKLLKETLANHDLKTPTKVLDKKEYFDDNLIKVRLKIDKIHVGRIYDEFSKIIVDKNGDFEVEFDCPKGEWLLNYIISYGEHCRILQPIELNDKLKNYLEKILKNIK